MHPKTGKQFKIEGFYTCRSVHVYFFKCPCGVSNVGETTRQVKVRIGEYKSSIRLYSKKSPVAHHFKDATHLVAQLRYQVIDSVEKHARLGRQGVETKTTRKLLGGILGSTIPLRDEWNRFHTLHSSEMTS